MSPAITQNLTNIKNQQGIVLVVSLLILVVMTVLGVSMLSSTTLGERMASNLQSKNATFQAAESCIRSIRLPASSALLGSYAIQLYQTPTLNIVHFDCAFNGVASQVDFSSPTNIGIVQGADVTKFTKYPLTLEGSSSLASGATSSLQAIGMQPAPK